MQWIWLDLYIIHSIFIGTCTTNLDECTNYNYNDLTVTSLESWLVRGIIPKWYFMVFRLLSVWWIITIQPDECVFERESSSWVMLSVYSTPPGSKVSSYRRVRAMDKGWVFLKRGSDSQTKRTKFRSTYHSKAFNCNEYWTIRWCKTDATRWRWRDTDTKFVHGAEIRCLPSKMSSVPWKDEGWLAQKVWIHRSGED